MFESVKKFLGFDVSEANENNTVENESHQADDKEINDMNKINIREVNELINNLRDNLGDACVASSIISYDQGSSIAAFNFDEKTAALVGKYTTFLQDMVVKSGMGSTCKYYAVNLPNNMMSFHLIFKNYCWTTFVDIGSVPLGMIMNAVLPDCIERFQEVIE